MNENDPLGLRIDHSDSHIDNSSTRGARANDEISLAPGQTERDEVLSHDPDGEFHSRRSVLSYLARINTAKRDKYSRYLRDESDDNNNRLLTNFLVKFLYQLKTMLALFWTKPK